MSYPKYTQGDEGLCPTCYSTSVKIGEIYVDKQPQDARKCNSCSTVFTGLPTGSIAQLVTDVGRNSSGNVTFVSTTGAGVTENSSFVYTDTTTPIKLDWEDKQKLDNIKYAVESLNNTIIDLSTVIKNLINENKSLMEKVLTDPLVNIRKDINEFNLK